MPKGGTRTRLYMRGVMLDPSRGTAQPIDTTDEEDRTTPEGHARLRVCRGIFWRRDHA